MADFTRLLNQGLRLFRMYQRYSGSRGPASRSPRSGGTTPPPTVAHERGTSRARPGTAASSGRITDYPGDWTGPVNPRWAAKPDGRPDPGEVVWTWVPYQEDHSRGKDRPVLIVDRAGEHLLCVMLTSKDHDSAGHDDPSWVDVGVGGWDRSGRPSEARVDRIIPVRPQDVRREGAVLDRARFEAVAAELTGRR
ncbi:type II toxin-antitoxin system PemK/MazF family toxin [Kocuria tytonicola]|uniref:Type II toxin-antitoxin system PemK/MazF family toxin n=1 Tax=Kocuria tytonicola TaxID=2055946 RepID=A0A3L9L7L4_9MICC|nr:type II toxin-antitoxin system PemK/MazF family toxin [Kocuria tytonicola]RLY94976.1 type II toxin-antitoxin system PemK/MazF family toxin [Kocuria tytonicola]